MTSSVDNNNLVRPRKDSFVQTVKENTKIKLATKIFFFEKKTQKEHLTILSKDTIFTSLDKFFEENRELGTTEDIVNEFIKNNKKERKIKSLRPELSAHVLMLKGKHSLPKKIINLKKGFDADGPIERITQDSTINNFRAYYSDKINPPIIINGKECIQEEATMSQIRTLFSHLTSSFLSMFYHRNR